MEIIDHLLLGLSVAGTTTNLLYCLLGALIGTLIGVLPGLGPTSTISMLLPMTYALGPIPSIIMLSGIYYGSQYGGSTTSILLNTPGEAASVMTCIDGHEMTKQGKPGVAIFAAGFASFIAGCIATVLIAQFSPPLSDLAFRFGPAEYCMMMAFGFISVGILTTGDLIRGVGMAMIGVLIGFVGTDLSTGLSRYTFGIADLEDGIGFVTIAIGVFAIGEIAKNIASNADMQAYKGKVKVFPSWEEFKRIIPPSIRGSLVGSFFGLIPGGSAAISSYAAYAVDKKFSKNKDQFGKGAIEGVAAPEAANNAAAQTGFIPLLSFGLPENATMALMLGALVMNGVQPGPGMLDKQPELFWGLVVSMLIGNIILLILNVPLVRIWVQIVRIPYHVLYPMIIAVCCVGAYSVHNNPHEVMLLGLFGLLGYIFNILDLEPAPLMLGLVLGTMFEEYFRRQLAITGGDFTPFVTRPISLSILCLIAITVVFGVWEMVRDR
jgi:putative tricarboxylic transport membrane protein